MSNYDAETLRLIDALPALGNRSELDFHGGCPMAYDASGSRASVFEAIALEPEMAEALANGQTLISLNLAEKLSHVAKFRDPQRISEYAGCLLTRATNGCVQFDAVNNRDRTHEERADFLGAN